MNRKSLILTAAALLLIIVGALVGYTYLSRGESAPQLSENDGEAAVEGEGESAPQPAPDFTVYDAEGNEITLSVLMDGKPTVLNFWASWCGPCKREMPDFESIYQELGEDVEFMMVNVTDGSRETRDSAAEFIAGEGYTFPVYYDSQLEAATAYGVYSIPSTYFIDAEGYAVARASGALSADTLQAGIGMITD